MSIKKYTLFDLLSISNFKSYLQTAILDIESPEIFFKIGKKNCRVRLVCNVLLGLSTLIY